MCVVSKGQQANRSGGGVGNWSGSRQGSKLPIITINTSFRLACGVDLQPLDELTTYRFRGSVVGLSEKTHELAS